jgi:hypothetical protein
LYILLSFLPVVVLNRPQPSTILATVPFTIPHRVESTMVLPDLLRASDDQCD